LLENGHHVAGQIRLLVLIQPAVVHLEKQAVSAAQVDAGLELLLGRPHLPGRQAHQENNQAQFRPQVLVGHDDSSCMAARTATSRHTLSTGRSPTLVLPGRPNLPTQLAIT
jgi:hypothetical protein